MESFYASPGAALRRVLEQCGGNISRLAGLLEITPPAIHRWLRDGHVPPANAPAIEKISRARVAELGLPPIEVVLCEYLCPGEPWHVLRDNALSRQQRALAELARERRDAAATAA